MDLDVRGTVSHIALFLPSLVGGGAERVFLTLAESFLDRGVRVDLVAAGIFGDLVHQIDARIRVFDLGKKRVLTAIPGLVHYLRAERPAVLLSALTHANIIAILSNKLASSTARLIISEHLSLKVNAGLKHRMLYPLAKLLYPMADAIIAVSNGVASDLRTLLVSNKKIQVIQNPVDLEKIHALSHEAPNHPWIRDKEVPLIVSAGRLHPNKDYPTLLKAFATINNHRPSRLIILGQGEERQRLEELVGQLDLNEVVAMPGYVENPYPYMSHSDAFVMCSVYEGLPTVLIEALACGATIVSTDCPSGPAEILANGEFGTLVPVSQPDALAEAVIQALDQPVEPKRARERASIYDRSRISECYLDLIRRVLQKEQNGSGG